MSEIKLTQYSHGAGCGCKISPAILDKMLHSSLPKQHDSRLLVGNKDRDDAAVYDLGNGTALISTTDFFMPIVDSPYDFGRVAATNAISDVYAMGGNPVLAIAILGWPVNELAPEIAQQVLEGARSVCIEAGISLAGGHSIDSPEPIFGLAVNGLVEVKNLKQNSTANEGSLLYLTKPLGVGVFSTAQKKNMLSDSDATVMLDSMTQLNKLGALFGTLPEVTAMTDVTGFGLLGHLSEMCEGSGLLAEVNFEKVPVFQSVFEYIAKQCVPGGTTRNWNSYGHKVKLADERQKLVLADPQTSGGLLVAVLPQHADKFEKLLTQHNCSAQLFGKLVKPNGQKHCIEVL